MKTARTILAALLMAGGLLPGLCWGQAPDLTTNQTVGVNESEFFFLGPTGMKGWMYWSDLTAEARQILVTEVRTNTPAYGVMQYHDVIVGIGGGVFTNDARAAFVDAIVDCQATGNGGQLDLSVFRPSLPGQTNVLTLSLREMGTRTVGTTPYNCDWADGVLSNYCEYVYTNGPTGAPVEGPSIWAMLASGEPKYVDWARDWITNEFYASRADLNIYRDSDQKVWYTAYQLITLCQYYLLTSDNFVLPAITNTAQFIAQGQDLHGLWGHTMAWPANNGGELHGTLPGYGALNQAGLAALYGLVLAQKCGISDTEVDTAVEKGAHFFRSHVDVGGINYGYGSPAYGVTDSNGRMGIAAHIFRALGEPEVAKWYTMMTATYKWRDWGHTGNTFNHCWGPTAADIGGPELANFIHTEREVSGPFYLASLVMRTQPEGNFMAQNVSGRGSTARGDQATGAYAVQLAANRSEIEITGAGYNTNDYWLTAAEMQDVVFAQSMEAPGYGPEPADMTTSNLIDHLDTFCTKVAYRLADELALRAGTNASLRATLAAMVEDSGAPDRERVAALKALSTNNVLVKATTDTWYYPSKGYALNWGAARFGASGDIDTWTNVMAAVVQFDTEKGFDALTVSQYASKIYNMDPGLLDADSLALYYDVTEIMLDPDVGAGAWVNGQDIKNWDPLVIARYADAILRAAELYAEPYDAIDIMAHNQIGEGMHSVTLRAMEYGAFPKLTENNMLEYGQNWWAYTNFTRAMMPYRTRTDNHYELRHIIEFTTQNPAPPVQWFRELIATNIANTLTNPATRLADLRYNMTVGEEDDLFHAVCLDQIVAHPDNADPFVDLTNAVGPTAPVPGSHWRLHAGAVELAVADTNSVARWLSALTQAQSGDDRTAMAGILHALAAKDAAGALPAAEALLDHESDAVAMGAVDLIGHVGTSANLLPLFNSYMTNSTTGISEDLGVGFKLEYWHNAHWDAITRIIDRDYAGCLTVADQLAASFNVFTQNGTDHEAVPRRTLVRPEPFPVLTPAMSDRPVLGYDNGVYHVLGRFARDNANCWDAIVNVINASTDDFYNRGHNFTACEALLQQFSYPELIALQADPYGDKPWNSRGLEYYLLDSIVLEKVPVASQLDVFEVNNRQFIKVGVSYYGEAWQKELTYRRGLEETEGMFFFGID